LRIKFTLALLAFTLSGCAARRPVSANWRYIDKDSAVTLVPPGTEPALVRRKLKIDVATASGSCPAPIHKQKHRLRVTVDRDTLSSRPQGWLTTWTGSLESDGCLAPGQAPLLATNIAESLPLDPETTRRILYPNDLVPPARLEVVSPVLRDPTDKADQFTVVEPPAGTSAGLNLALKASDNFNGYETAVYAIRLADSGYSILPLYADRHIARETQRISQPATNYFSFAPDAAFYRLFMKSGQTDFTALVLAASSRPELDRETALLDAGPASCDRLPAAHCVVIPRRVAINAVAPVTINGSETLIRWGATLGEAIRAAGVREPLATTQTLTISRRYNGRPTPVDFDRTSPAILRLPLMGGEIITWSKD
jgi:hypothetical protein